MYKPNQTYYGGGVPVKAIESQGLEGCFTVRDTKFYTYNKKGDQVLIKPQRTRISRFECFERFRKIKTDDVSEDEDCTEEEIVTN